MIEYITIRDETNERNVSLSVNAKGEIHLLGGLKHGSKLNITTKDAGALMDLLSYMFKLHKEV